MNRRRRGKPGKGGKQAILDARSAWRRSRSFVMESLTTKDVFKVLRENADLKSNLMTDEGTSNNWEFAKHDKVKHGAKEYVRYDHTFDENNKLHTKTITTNTVEGFFGVFKRGMRGTYQHCGPQHLQRYMDEFDFRYSNRTALGVDDTERAVRAIRARKASASRIKLLVQRNKLAREIRIASPDHGDFGDFLARLGLALGGVRGVSDHFALRFVRRCERRRIASVARRSASLSLYGSSLGRVIKGKIITWPRNGTQ